jgi:hypothetical protein
MLCRVALIRSDVLEEHVAFIIRVTIIGELSKTLAVISNRRNVAKEYSITLIMEAIHPSQTSAFTNAAQRNIPVDGILHLSFIS